MSITVQTRTSWAQFPDDLFGHILEFMPDLSTFTAVQRVCKSWNKMALATGKLDVWGLSNFNNARLASLVKLGRSNPHLLTSLSLSGAELDNDGLNSLAGLPLTSFSLSSYRNFTAITLSFLKGMPLKFLRFVDCNIKDINLIHLKRLPLESLQLRRCSAISELGLKKLTMPTLNSLFLCDTIRDITPDGIQTLIKLPLTDLTLWDVNINDANLLELQTMNLTSLQLNRCRTITKDGLKALSTSLTTLSLVDSQFTDKDLESLKKLSLTSLNLIFNNKLTNGVFDTLKLLPLKTICLEDCPRITEAAKQSFQGLFPTALLTGNMSAATKQTLNSELDLLGDKFIQDLDDFVFLLSNLLPNEDFRRSFYRFGNVRYFKMALALAYRSTDPVKFQQSFVPRALELIGLLNVAINNVLPLSSLSDVDWEKFDPKIVSRINSRFAQLNNGSTLRNDHFKWLRSALISVVEEECIPALSTLKTDPTRQVIVVK